MHLVRRAAIMTACPATLLSLWSAAVMAQGTAADYARAEQLNARYQGLAVNVVDHQAWVGKTSRLDRKSVV